MQNIEYEFGNYPGASEDAINFTEKNLAVSLPKDYINIIKKVDRGTPKKNTFQYLDPVSEKIRKGTLTEFLSFDPGNPNNILREFFSFPDTYRRKILPFADASASGDADYLCFDYSLEGWRDPDPPVICWLRSRDEGNNLAYVAINFKTFLEKLNDFEE